ncbi:allantoinase [Faunimonas pinastri]|uniref:Allantoinase n=1 Tax=Faunimonas pinastri TaxID=1855383 RepID=A0A1H9INK6_9HYPH|nr:allantoinase AllB [Faunimonas pinastri]SEQ76174.1 allantoinase [Faunimonas pinastri]
MLSAELYIRNAQIVTETDTFRGGVLVENGRIVALVEGEPEHGASETFDAGGMLLLPGLVDAHVHFSEPGRTHWEGFLTGTQAAAAGGITTVVEMPLNASPPTVNAEALLLKQQAAARSALVDYALWGGLVDDNRADLADLQAGGVAGFKAFMCASSTDFPRVDDVILQVGLIRAREFGSFVAVHAEDEEMSQKLMAELRDRGRTDRRAWGEARPPEVELSAIRAALALTGRTGSRLHVVHVSTAEGIDLISNAKAEGVRVTAETCPHYLFFSEEDLVRIGPEAKCAPPLRSPERVEALWDRVLAGAVDVIGSDHSPCLREEKEAGCEDIFKAWGGISGLQSTLPALITAGVARRGLAWTDLVRMISANPARLFGLYPRKGALAAGSDADLTLVDPDAVSVLRSEDLFYKNPHSAYVGQEMRGRVLRTWVRGRAVYADRRIVAEPGFGQLLRGPGLPENG